MPVCGADTAIPCISYERESDREIHDCNTTKYAKDIFLQDTLSIEPKVSDFLIADCSLSIVDR